jgi:hypothetical protein
VAISYYLPTYRYVSDFFGQRWTGHLRTLGPPGTVLHTGRISCSTGGTSRRYYGVLLLVRVVIGAACVAVPWTLGRLIRMHDSSFETWEF